MNIDQSLVQTSLICGIAEIMITLGDFSTEVERNLSMRGDH